MHHAAPRSRLWRLAFAWLAGLCVGGFATTAAAQVDESSLGQNLIITRNGVQLRALDPETGKNRIIGVVGEAEVRLDRIQGDWLWVKTASQEGWITKADAIPVDQAISYFTDRIQKNANDDYAFNQRYSAWLKKPDLDRALADITEAIRLVPLSSAYRHNRGAIWRQKNDNEKALVDFDEALRLDKNSVMAYCHRGETYYDLGQYDKSLADATEAIRLMPRFAVAYSDRGWTWLAKNETDIAVEDFTEAIRLDPKLFAAYRGRAKIFQTRKDYDKALADFNAALVLQPGWAVVHSERGWVFFDTNQFDKAFNDFDEAIRLNPDVAYAYRGRGQTLQSLKNYDAAVPDLGEFIRLTPGQALGYLDRGWLWIDMKQYPKALDDFNEALRADPKGAYAHRGRGNCYRALKDYDTAIAEFNELIRLLPEWDAAYYDRAETWYAKKDFDRAIEDYTAAIRIFPKYTDAYTGRALSWRLKRDFERAVADINEAVRLAPKNWTTVFQRANIFRGMKQYTQAITDYDEALRLNPGFAGIVATRGYTYFLNKEYDKALADFDQANEIDPKQGWAYRNRAMLYAASPDDQYRDGAKAREQLEKARELLPPASDVYEAEAAVAAENGDFDAAVKWQQRVLEDPSYRMNPDMPARLEVYRKKQPYREGMDLAEYVPQAPPDAPTNAPTDAPAAPPTPPVQDGFVSIFDGKSLTGWTGKPEYWSADNGVLRGKVVSGLNGSTFLVWQGTAGDFELRFKFRFKGGNSGIQFRSADLGNDVVAGYQADIGLKDRSDNGITGRLFDEKIRRDRFLTARQGQEIAIDPSGIVSVIGTTATADEVARLASIADTANATWHDYQIAARGPEIALTVDGVVTTKLIDRDPGVRKSGVIAIQLWRITEVEFKEMFLKQIDGVAAFAAGPPADEPQPVGAEKAGSPKETASDLKLLRGTWVCVLSLKDGDAVDKYVGVRAVIDGENLTWLYPEPDGKFRERKNKFRIDPTKTPKQFDDWPVDKPEVVDLRIYSISPNMLRWATNLDGKTRPASFDAGHWQFTMKRVVAEEKKAETPQP